MINLLNIRVSISIFFLSSHRKTLDCFIHYIGFHTYDPMNFSVNTEAMIYFFISILQFYVIECMSLMPFETLTGQSSLGGFML